MMPYKNEKNLIIIKKVPESIVISNLITFILQKYQILTYVVNSKSKNIILKLKNQDDVEIILSEKLYFRNKLLEISSLSHGIHQNNDKGQSFANLKLFNFIHDQTFEQQLSIFLNTISLKEDNIQKYYAPICQALKKVFCNYFHKINVIAFGSTTMGLAFQNSDLDVILNLGIPVVKDACQVNGPHVVSTQSAIIFIEKILRINNNLFAKCQAIPGAKVPIVKCIYVPTKINCDISFTTKLGVYNSELIRFFLSIDSRFKPLVMILRYWIQLCELKCSTRITKYALTIMVIFYLETNGMAPTVADLQKECSMEVLHQGFQVNINKNFAKYEHKRWDIPRLLQGFFDFYSKYDFSNSVLCPHDGNIYSREVFEKRKLPSTMSKYKNPIELNTSTPLCLQDPIELNRNITENLLHVHVNKFQLFCSIASNIVEDSSKNNYKNLLSKLLQSVNN